MEIHEQNKKIMKAFHQFRKLNFSSIIPDITPMEFHLLSAVAEAKEEQGNSDVTVSAACRIMHTSSAAGSRILRVLEEKGFIYREVDTKDRRKTYIRVTKRGEEVYQDVKRIMDDLVSAILERVGQEEVDQMVETLTRIYEIAEEEISLRKKQGTPCKHKDERKEAGYGPNI